jgi:hypothetical protein
MAASDLDPTPTVRRSRLGRISPRGCSSPALVAATFFGSSFFFSFPTSSASTSFVSRCTGPRDFARFDIGSLFFRELLCFLKVDLLIHCDCTVECSLTPSVIGDRPSHPIYRVERTSSRAGLAPAEVQRLHGALLRQLRCRSMLARWLAIIRTDDGECRSETRAL